jgi:hypothetical protein
MWVTSSQIRSLNSCDLTTQWYHCEYRKILLLGNLVVHSQCSSGFVKIRLQHRIQQLHEPDRHLPTALMI